VGREAAARRADLAAASGVDAAERLFPRLDPEGIPYRSGRVLAFDPERERFDDEEANTLLSRPYRRPFVVPEKIS